MHWVYYFGRGLIRFLVFLVGSWHVEGKENIPSQGPVLVVCNHLHIADPPIVAASIPLKCVFMAKDDLWKSKWSRFWVENFGAFPVRRGGVDREALHTAEFWLKQGVSLIMFPEGSRSKNAQMQPALPGAALIASRLGVPVLPASITGTDKIKKLGRCILHRTRITVTFGKPFIPPVNNGKLNREQRSQLMYDIMKKIAALLPPEYHGVYAGGDDAQNRESQ